MAPTEPAPWPRRPRTDDGMWDAIADLREAIDSMVDQRMIEKAVAGALTRQRSQWLTSGRGLVVIALMFLTAAAAVATAAHSWVG